MSLPDGSTTNDARLEDICNGYDNTVYDSPGESVRTQINNTINFINNKSLIKKTLDSNITDLNDISESGIYFLSSTITKSLNNIPTNDGCILIDCNDNNSTTRHYQIIITYYDNIIYVRGNENGNWRSWKRIIDESRLNTLISTISSNISSVTSDLNKCFKQISNVTNCDDAPTGYIYFPSTDNVLNVPGNIHRGCLYTFIGTENNIYQYWLNGTGLFYVRTKNGGQWLDWKLLTFDNNTFNFTEIQSDDDIDTLSNFKAYFISSSYTSDKLPSQNGGVLFNYIYPGRDSTRHYQIFMAYNNKIYIRNKNVGIFTDWKELLTGSSIQDVSNKTNLIKKDNDTQFTIYFGDYNIKLLKIEDETINSHAWNILDIRDVNNNILVPYGTDIIGPIKESGEADFMGGVHGDETATIFEIYCDGNVYDRESTVKFDSLDIIMQSNLHRVSTKEIIANRKIHISITDNEIHVYSQITALTNFTVERCTNGGLIAARNNIITGLFINNYLLNEAPDTSISGIRSKFNTSATIFTSLGKITVENIIGHALDTYRGYISVFTNENPIRTKIYLDTISSQTDISTNDTITGEFKYTFNK